jgi:acetyltransferase
LRFLERLSPQTLYLRAQYVASALPLKEIERLLDLDYVDRMAVAALVTRDDEERIIGVSRYARIDTSTRADCAIVIADEWQGWGLGTELMRTLALAALARGYTEFEGTALGENRRFAAWAKRFGFDVRTEPHSGGLLKISLRLSDLAGRT